MPNCGTSDATIQVCAIPSPQPFADGLDGSTMIVIDGKKHRDEENILECNASSIREVGICFDKT